MKKPTSILITGASSGIGEALALKYANKNTTLFLCGRNQGRLNDIIKRCEEKGTTVKATIINVNNKAETKNWILDCNKEQELDLVIANAGISGGSNKGHEAIEQTIRIFDTNIYGVLHTIYPAIELFKAKGEGQIAITSSLAGYNGLPSAPAYSASKACVKALGKALRGQLSRFGIKVSTICPGFVRSRITDENEHIMPFFMEADKAANIIIKGLEKNKGIIAFPWQMRFLLYFISTLPSFISDAILKRVPDKKK